MARLRFWYNAIKDDEKRHLFRDKLGGYVRPYAFLSQIMPYTDRELEMLYSFERLLLPHLRKDRDLTVYDNCSSMKRF